jgi:NAD(P)-dependent dehydrogenase (short-subunit alcohol dehydrogenase family)
MGISPLIDSASKAAFAFPSLSLEISADKVYNRVNNMAQTTAYQLQRTNVRVNSICPGLIETGMTTTTFDYARTRGTASKIGQLNPLGRYAIPEGIPGHCPCSLRDRPLTILLIQK